MSKTFVLKENDEAIRQRVSESGIKVCPCASFNNACWLDYHVGITDQVHGVGYANEDTTEQDNVLSMFMYEHPHAVYCADVDEFISKIKEYDKENY